MPSQKPQKPVAELTTDEAIRSLFPDAVVDRMKQEAENPSKNTDTGGPGGDEEETEPVSSMPED
jgi:hypothetical protein